MNHFRSIALAAAFALTAPALAHAQATDTAAIAEQQQAMKKLAWMHGVWRGPAISQSTQGEHRVTQTERIGGMLDGTVTVMEGKGYNPDGSVGFNALGVASYDPATKSYWLTSWALGHNGKFALTPTANGYVWEVPAGPMKMRYTATLAGDTWTEVGDYVTNGKPPQRFFQMTLKRVGDSTWPAAGGIAKE